ncbi:MAG: nucleotidyl transferase AbiEii/AbiGii toxin family protein [Actinobacteria bacterium]|nr:nucleotidyl transferase AbiEii/AbiGii toxin family protein [Actinomycetota bacterium]
MIPEAETRRLAAAKGVDLMVIDLDYALGWLLAGLFSDSAIRDSWIFKGGTSLKKCWFPEYRFSEDLDFTVHGRLDVDMVQNLLKDPLEKVAQLSGIDLNATAPRFELVSDEYGKESLQGRLYHRSTIQRTGSPQAIRIDLSADEVVIFPPVSRQLMHPYSDSASLPKVAIPCYSLEEVVAEKLRAVGGQRHYAIARDIYDIHQLTSTGVDLENVMSALGEKFAVKGLKISPGIVTGFVDRRDDYRLDWERRVENLEAGLQVEFDVAFQTVTDMLERIIEEYCH